MDAFIPKATEYISQVDKQTLQLIYIGASIFALTLITIFMCSCRVTESVPVKPPPQIKRRRSVTISRTEFDIIGQIDNLAKVHEDTLTELESIKQKYIDSKVVLTEHGIDEDEG